MGDLGSWTELLASLGFPGGRAQLGAEEVQQRGQSIGRSPGRLLAKEELIQGKRRLLGRGDSTEDKLLKLELGVSGDVGLATNPAVGFYH